MIKKIFILTVLILSISTGCFNKINENNTTDKIYLNDKYYNKGEFKKIKNLSNLDNDNYILFTYNNYCDLAIPCENIFKDFMTKYKIDFLSMPFEEFKKTEFYKTIKYAPSIVIIKKGSIIAYLDANSDEDLEKYQDVNKFEEWLNNYIYISK